MNPQGATEFEPSIEWLNEDDCDTLLVYLPGFIKEQLKVQLRSRTLIISGQRKLHDNTWTRFRKELPIAEHCDLTKINAKFEGSILNVKMPKSRTHVAKQEEKTTTNAPTPTPEKPNVHDREQADSKLEGSEKVVEKKDDGRVNELKESKGVCNVSKKMVMELKVSRYDVLKVLALILGFVVGFYCAKSIQSWIA